MSVVSQLMLEIASKQSIEVTEEVVSAVPVMASEPKWSGASERHTLKEATSKDIWFYYRWASINIIV